MKARMTDIDLTARFVSYDEMPLGPRRVAEAIHGGGVELVEVWIDTCDNHTLINAFKLPFIRMGVLQIDGLPDKFITDVRTNNIYLYNDDWSAYGVIRRPTTNGRWSKFTGTTAAFLAAGVLELGETALKTAMFEAKLEAL